MSSYVIIVVRISKIMHRVTNLCTSHLPERFPSSTDSILSLTKSEEFSLAYIISRHE